MTRKPMQKSYALRHKSTNVGIGRREVEYIMEYEYADA